MGGVMPNFGLEASKKPPDAGWCSGSKAMLARSLVRWCWSRCSSSAAIVTAFEAAVALRLGEDASVGDFIWWSEAGGAFRFFVFANRLLLGSLSAASLLLTVLSVPWVLIWRCMLPFVVKAIRQIRHLNGLSPEWISIWRSSELAELKVLPHMLHVCEWSVGLCCRICCVNACCDSRIVSQTGHVHSPVSSFYAR